MGLFWPFDEEGDNPEKGLAYTTPPWNYIIPTWGTNWNNSHLFLSSPMVNPQTWIMGNMWALAFLIPPF